MHSEAVQSVPKARLTKDRRVFCWRRFCRGQLGRLVLFRGGSGCRGHLVLRLEPRWVRQADGSLVRRGTAWRHARYSDPITWLVAPRSDAQWLDARHEPICLRCPQCRERSVIEQVLEAARCDCALDDS